MTLRILMALLFSFWLMADPYQKFAKQIASGEMPHNFSELRWACMLSSHCDAAASLKWGRKFEQAMASEAYEEAAQIAEKAVAAGVVDVAAHEMCVMAYTKAGNEARADFHRRVQAALLSSYGGDGCSKENENLRNPGVQPNLTYEYKGYQPHPNGRALSRERMEQYDKEGRLYFPKDKDGRIRRKRYLDEQPGQKLQSLWDDIPPINSQAQERLGYPTQKPLALLERVIAASSNEGDVVLDPFWDAVQPFTHPRNRSGDGSVSISPTSPLR